MTANKPDPRRRPAGPQDGLIHRTTGNATLESRVSTRAETTFKILLDRSRPVDSPCSGPTVAVARRGPYAGAECRRAADPNRLGVVMLSRPLPRFAIVATVLFSLASGPYFAQAAPADDAPKTAHESAVLDRIFANWKARHDQVRSFHFVYDCRMTHRKGSPDPLKSLVTPLEHDEIFDEIGAQLWMEGDDRLCWVDTPRFKLAQAQRRDGSRITFRMVIVGKTAWWYDTGPLYETGGAPSPAVQTHALLYPAVRRAACSPTHNSKHRC